MVDVYVARGILKRRGGSPSRTPHVEQAPLTGASLVRAFMQINPARVKAATP